MQLYTTAEKAPVSLNVGGKVQPCYSGQIVEVSERHVIQKIRANGVIAHERANFEALPTEGKGAKIVYVDGKARNVEAVAVSRDRQRGR